MIITNLLYSLIFYIFEVYVAFIYALLFVYESKILLSMFSDNLPINVRIHFSSS